MGVTYSPSLGPICFGALVGSNVQPTQLMGKRHRVIGTTEEALLRAESQLGKSLPASFRAWLLEHNGKGLDSIDVFPVLDDRDIRKTWDSIVRQYENWRSYCADVLEEVDLIDSLIPFSSFGTGDYYCFDYSRIGDTGEPAVVLWSHETGLTSPRGESFEVFVEKLKAGEFQYD